ncbi:MAG: co-chaperone GroES [Candidatus Xenobium sp.]|jgi:co-chaperonin GroES (HSP10)|nr:co-chaperone GroES [Burkholderiales bacterium]
MPELIVVGDRILIEPLEGEQQTESGLILPATATERDKVRNGLVLKVGPGYLVPNPEYSEAEPWKKPRQANRYLPLQAEPGDQAFFLKDQSIEITWQGKNLLIVPHSAILVLLRPEPSDVLNKIDKLLGN